MRIRNFAHKGLKRPYADDTAKGVPPGTVDKLRKMLAFLDDLEDPEELRTPPLWNAHTLTGDRKGTWSLEHFSCCYRGKIVILSGAKNPGIGFYSKIPRSFALLRMTGHKYHTSTPLGEMP